MLLSLCCCVESRELKVEQRGSQRSKVCVVDVLVTAFAVATVVVSNSVNKEIISLFYILFKVSPRPLFLFHISPTTTTFPAFASLQFLYTSYLDTSPITSNPRLKFAAFSTYYWVSSEGVIQFNDHNVSEMANTSGDTSVDRAERMWQPLSAAMNRGFGIAITFPDATKAHLGPEGMATIIAHYRLVNFFSKYHFDSWPGPSRVIGVPAVVEEDTTRGITTIHPPRTTWGPVIIEAPEETVISKKAKLPRPPNAFILYRQRHHPRVKEAYPDLHNNQICKSLSSRRGFFLLLTFVAAIILGKQWKSEDIAVKALYKRKADDLKKKHMEDHPDYQYQPRKPAEKKRRMTRRKVEALSGGDDPLEGASTQMASAAIGTPLDIEFSPVFPVFEATPAGNPVVTFGAEDFDDETFENMLKNLNESVSAADPQAKQWTQVLYTERTKEAEDDFTFYQGEDDTLLSDVQDLEDWYGGEVGNIFKKSEAKESAWSGMEPEQQVQEWDANYQHDPTTESQILGGDTE